MLRKNYVVVDSANKALWVRSVLGCTPAVAVESLAVIRANTPREPLYLLESDEDSNGDEVAARLMTPILANPLTQALATVEVWHHQNPTFEVTLMAKAPPEVNLGEYARVAEMLAPAHDPLETVYEATQNLFQNWNVPTRSRSSSVGDVFIVRAADGSRQAHIVLGLGFAPVQLQAETASA